MLLNRTVHNRTVVLRQVAQGQHLPVLPQTIVATTEDNAMLLTMEVLNMQHQDIDWHK